MKSKDIPIKSTWRDPIGKKLTNRKITTRIKEGWYGEIEKLRLLARSTNKSIRKEARENLKRFDGALVTRQRAKRTVPIPDISSFV